MTTLIEIAVPIADLATVTNTTPAEVEAEAASLGLYVGVDWAGRPALGAEDAHGIVTGRLRQEHDERARWLAHAGRLDHWERAIENARMIAWQEVHDEGVRRGSPAGVAADAGHQAAQVAVERFERNNPQPSYDTEPTSRIARAGRALKEAVR